MLDNGRKNIGVFVFQAIDHFQQKLCEGVEDRCHELGYNTIVFSSFGNFADNEPFAKGEEIILEIPNYDGLDGVILALDTFDIVKMRYDILEKLEKEYHGPIVSVRTEADNADYNMLLDDYKTMDGIIRHFIEDHGFRDICFMTGMHGNPDAERRLDNYKEVMKEYGFPVDESMYMYADFWKWKGKEACDYFIDQRGKLPEAILCANDYMGISVCHELQGRGIRVPEDVAVCGCDGVWATTVCAPPLTTAEVDFHKMGVTAVDAICGGVTEKNTYFSPDNIFRESCGCTRQNQWEELRGRKNFYNLYEQERSGNLETTIRSIDLESINTFRELRYLVGGYLPYIHGCQQFDICLQGQVRKNKKGVPYGEPMSDMMEMVVGADDRRKINKSIRFERKYILPKEMVDSEPMILYVVPFHFKERNLGYTVAQMRHGHGGGYSSVYQEWTVTLENAVQDLFNRDKMDQMIDRLTMLSIHDPMTGVYNRFGFEQEGRRLYYKAREDGKNVFFLSIDLDGLKRINDHWGHGEGDQAICAVTACLKKVNKRKAVISRMGGDEFSVVGTCKDREELDRFIKDFKEHLAKEDAKHEYTIYASVGECMLEPNSDKSWEACILESDNLMYKRKRSSR